MSLARRLLFLAVPALLAACDADLGAAPDGDVATDVGDGFTARARSIPAPAQPDDHITAPTTSPLVAPSAAELALANAAVVSVAWTVDTAEAFDAVFADVARAVGATSAPDALAATLALTPLARDAWTAVVADGEVLLSTVTTPAWHGGAARAERTRAGLYTMSRPVAAEAVPAWVRDLVGRRVTAVAADGRRCEVEIGALRLRSRFEHHPGEVELGLEPPPRLRVGGVVDEQMWERGERTLTASLRGGGRCARPLYVRSGGDDAPLLPTRRAPDAALAARAVEAFRAQPEWLDLQDLYATDRQYLGDGQALAERWDELYGERPAVVGYEAAHGARRARVVERDTDQGCGSPGGRLSAAFEVGPDGTLTRIYASEAVFAPAAIVDLDDDGALDAIGTGRRPSSYRAIDGELVPRQQRSIPDYTPWGCPC